jgi:hypothetical protein
MKKLFIKFIFILFHLNTFSQTCFCEKDSSLTEKISCKPIIFKNSAKIYNQFNCDSSWIEFDNNGSKNYLGSIELHFVKEYKNTFLMVADLPGCCTPPPFNLYNKYNGELINDFYLIDIVNQYGLSIDADGFEQLILYNFDNQTEKKIPLPKKVIYNTLRNSNVTNPEYLFEQLKIINNTMIIKYKTYNKFKKWEYHTIKHILTN